MLNRRLLTLGVLLHCCAMATAQVTSRQQAPARHYTDPRQLPRPYETASVDRHPSVLSRPRQATLFTPPGFKVQRWAGGLVQPRYMAAAPNGDIFVVESRANRISVLRDANGDGRPEKCAVFVGGVRQPFGIAFYPPGASPTHIYIAATTAVIRYPYRNGDLQVRGAGQAVVRLEGGGYNQHWTRTIVFQPDGKRFYLSVGSRSNASPEALPRAAITSYKPDGSDARTYASGVRNAVGLAFNPVTGALWAAVNERDGLGDRLPPDYVTAIRPGGFYGWPYYYLGGNADPRLTPPAGMREKVIAPDVLLEAHCAALSVQFYTGSRFPAAYRHDAYVAMHGSWNRRDPVGYKIVRIPMKPDGTPEGGYYDFVWGWRTGGGAIWGRPVALVQTRDGALLVSDDGGNCIWRVITG